MLDIQWLSKTRSRPRCHGISMCIRSDSSHGCSSIPSCQESQKSIFSLMQLLADAVPIDQCATWLLVGPDASVHGRSRGGCSAGVDDRSGARGSACSRCIFAIRRTCHIPKFGNLGAHLEIGRPRIGQPGQRSPSSSRPDEKGVGGRHGETVLEFSCPNRLGNKLIRPRGPRRARPPNRHCTDTAERGGQGEQQKQLPRHPTQEGYGQGSRMQDDVQLHDHDLRHDLDDWPQRRPSRGLFPLLDVRDRPEKTATPPRENPGRLETELRTRACRAPAFPAGLPSRT